ncbi:MAG: Rrf2 family transcriptional regulator, cysteine metabolism repressor [Clostridiales bacterium]|jgi:Rrf2 family protein|nr:Rrf2 family transcriptional regulator, cysteine metabolism repressor [Clostridiales bacterium]
MKMSTKCRYGLRALADLALSGSSSPIPLSQIAERQNLSVKYLEQEFAALRKAGFVRSVKGAQGGYILACAPVDIMISDVIRQLEGDLLLVDEPAPKLQSTPIKQCLQDVLWQPLNEQLERALSSVTLADIIADWQSGNDDNPMYYI